VSKEHALVYLQQYRDLPREGVESYQSVDRHSAVFPARIC